MRIIWRALLAFATFIVVGYTTMHVLIARAVARGTPEYSVRLGSAMGGLFFGGGAAVLVGIALLVHRRRPPASDQDDG